MLARLGLQALAPTQGAQVFAALLKQPELIQVAVARVDWQRFRPIYEARGQRRLLAELEVSPPPTARSELGERLAALDPAAARAQLTAHIREAVAATLGMTTGSEVDARRGFFDLGMDSLMAAELTQCLQLSLNAPLSAAVVFDHPTVETLADYLLREVVKVPAKTTTQRVVQTDSEETLIAEIIKLSDSEAEALLRQRLAEITEHDLE